jgi:hypothetical protein
MPDVQVCTDEWVAENVCHGARTIRVGEIAFNWELGSGAHTSAQLVELNGMYSAKEKILCEEIMWRWQWR